MKPLRILYFLIIISVFSIGLALIFPETGIKLTDHLTLNYSWRFNQINDNSPVYADITNIINQNKVIISDSVIIQGTDTVTDTIRANANALKLKVQAIEFPSGDSTILNPFFQKLDNSSAKRVRILHYGDSQIEGDRISGYLRNKFQQRFGGSGPGLMPALPGRAESSSIIHLASNNWIIHAIYYKKDTILPHRQFGMMGSFARFTTYNYDSINTTEIQKAWIEFKHSGMAYASSQNFTECRVFYGHVNAPFTTKGYVNDSLTWFEEMDTTQGTKTFKWKFTAPPSDFRIEFESTKSPDIYAIALDSKNGVSVDNMPFRGSSGSEFSHLNFKQLHEMGYQLNPGLIILEFGVNIVPNQVKNYSYYERILIHQINFLKNAFPKCSVLIIGVSDMAMRKGNYYISYPNIKKIKQAQRNAAKATNSAFWDLQEAMGGENSMPSWVFAKPTLASKDFIHFNRTGGNIIAQMLFNALMEQYNQYHSTKQTMVGSTSKAIQN